VTVDRSEVHERRMQFAGVTAGGAAEGDVPLGALPPKHADDTKIH
jgi:hypothetical protein